LYSAEKRRRVALAITSTSLILAPETATPFEELISLSRLAPYSKLLGDECLIHIRTEALPLKSGANDARPLEAPQRAWPDSRENTS